MPTDPQMLDNFVRVGQEILSCNWTTHYGPDVSRVAPSPPGVGYAQPGFLGRDYRGLVFIAQNPGVGDGRDDAHRDWGQAYRSWHEQGTVAAYSEVFEFWQRDLRAWDIWRDWIKPILDPLHFTEDHIGFLNLCKNATVRNKRPSEQMFESDWTWTYKQFELLQPTAVVAIGKGVAKQLNTYWPAPCFHLFFRNRVRARAGLSNDALVGERASEADLLVSKLKLLLP